MDNSNLKKYLDSIIESPDQGSKVRFYWLIGFLFLFFIGILGTGIAIGFIWKEPHRTADRLEAVMRRLAKIEATLGDMAPAKKIAEYDLKQSRVFEPCVIGEICEAVYVVRRTEYGVSCKTPKAQPRVVNHGGITRPVEFVDFEPIRLEGEWTKIGFSFQMPTSIIPGDAEFYTFLEYPGCEGAGMNEYKRERGVPLLFKAVLKG